jgi:hypothetical protein
MNKQDKNLIRDILNLLYELEMLHEYNETETGLQVGLMINKLQKTLQQLNK